MVRHIRLKAVSIIVPTISCAPAREHPSVIFWEIWEQMPRLFRILQAVITVRSIRPWSVSVRDLSTEIWKMPWMEYLPHWAIFSRMQQLPIIAIWSPGWWTTGYPVIWADLRTDSYRVIWSPGYPVCSTQHETLRKRRLTKVRTTISTINSTRNGTVVRKSLREPLMSMYVMIPPSWTRSIKAIT